jgi:multiple sugar transport system permease protein
VTTLAVSRRPRGHLARRIIRVILAHGALIAVSAAFAVPVLALISTSLKTLAQNIHVPAQWIPSPLYLHNYNDAVQIPPFVQMLENTLTVVSLEVVGTTAVSALVGYGFAAFAWRGRDAVFLLVIATMLIPYEITLIPQYILFGKFGWLNSYFPLTVPYFFGIGGSAGNGGLFIFLFRQFFLRIPRDFAEAARIDGASELRIFAQMYLPLAKPAVTVVALLQFIGGWNDFLGPLIYLNDRSLSTLVLGMEYFRLNPYQVNIGGQAAYAILIVLPVVVVFFFAQRRFIEGVTLSAVKG